MNACIRNKLAILGGDKLLDMSCIRTLTDLKYRKSKTKKYLGMLIDDNLSWKYHIVHLASKIRKTIGIIARLSHFVPL